MIRRSAHRGAFVVLLMLLPAPAAAQQAMDVVARVVCPASSQTGGGIVSRSTSDVLEIVTAMHIVKECLGSGATVELPNERGRQFNAAVVDPHSSLDLAVLRVTDRRAPRFTLEQLRVMGDSLAVRSGQTVRLITHTANRYWWTPGRADLVSTADGDVIDFQSSNVGSGASGGALLNGDGMIVGMIVSDTPTEGRALPIHRIQMNLTAKRFEISWGPPDRRTTTAPDIAGATPIRPLDPTPPPDEIIHGNIIYQMPSGWRRRAVSRDEHVLYGGSIEPPYAPWITLRTGGRLRAEFRKTVEASLAEGDNITAYRELRLMTARGIRMYRMDGAEMQTQNGRLYLFYAALNAGDRFEEIVLLSSSPYGEAHREALAVFEHLLNTVDLVNARQDRQAR